MPHVDNIFTLPPVNYEKYVDFYATHTESFCDPDIIIQFPTDIIRLIFQYEIHKQDLIFKGLVRRGDYNTLLRLATNLKCRSTLFINDCLQIAAAYPSNEYHTNIIDLLIKLDPYKQKRQLHQIPYTDTHIVEALIKSKLIDSSITPLPSTLRHILQIEDYRLIDTLATYDPAKYLNYFYENVTSHGLFKHFLKKYNLELIATLDIPHNIHSLLLSITKWDNLLLLSKYNPQYSSKLLQFFDTYNLREQFNYMWNTIPALFKPTTKYAQNLLNEWALTSTDKISLINNAIKIHSNYLIVIHIIENTPNINVLEALQHLTTLELATLVKTSPSIKIKLKPLLNHYIENPFKNKMKIKHLMVNG